MDSRAFEQIYIKYFDMLYRICFLYMKNEADALDIVQEVFEKILNEKDGYINVEDFHGADTLICSSSYYAAYLSNRSEEGGQSEPISIKIEDIESVTNNGHDFTLEEMK